MSAVLEIRHRWTVFSEPSLSWYGEALRTLQGFLAEWLSLGVPWLMALDELPLNEGSRGTDDVIAPGRGLWESLSPQTQNQSKASVDRRQTLIGRRRTHLGIWTNLMTILLSRTAPGSKHIY